MDNKYGIWLDKNRAIIVKIDTTGPQLISVESNIKTGTPKGGSGSPTPYGPSDKISESKYLTKQRQELKDYFNRLLENIIMPCKLIIYGPAEAKLEFANLITTNNLSINIESVVTCGKLTDKQVIHRVRKHFNF